MRIFSAFFSILILLLTVSIVKAEGTYGNIGTTSSNNGGYDAVSWSQGYPLTIDSYGKYIVPIQPDGNSNYNIAFSNDKGATWSEQNLPVDEEFSNRSSVAYDAINDKLHVIQATGNGIVYTRYMFLRDPSYNIYAVKEDPTLTPMIIDTLGSCSSDDYGNPVALFKNEGSNGILVAFWSLTKSDCGGQDITQTRGAMRILSNTSADGTAGNWDALNGTSSGGAGPASIDFNILYSANSAVSNIRQQSAVIRGGSGGKSEDIYYFNVDVDGANGFRRLSWNDAQTNWSGTWTSRATFGEGSGTDTGYTLKQELLTKPVYAEAHGKVYVGIARWLDDTSGDTQSLYSVDDTDAVSLESNVYSAGGQHCLYPTLDIAYDQVTGELYTFYLKSGASSVCGHTYYKTYDNDSFSSEQAYYTVPDRSIDIPVTYPTRYDDKILLFYRLNAEADPNTPPHEIHFGYVPLSQTTPPDVQDLSGGIYSATTYTDFEKLCSIKNTAITTDRDGGEVALAPSISDDFGTPLSPYKMIFLSNWLTGHWEAGSYYPQANGTLPLSGLPTSYTYSNTTKSRKVLEFRARFTAYNYQHIGFSDQGNFTRFVMFSTGNNGVLRTRVVDGGSETATVLGTDNLGAYHTYKIDWQTNNARFYIDDVLVDTITTNVPTASLNVMNSNSADTSGADLLIDWIHLYDYPDTTGSYVSCILDSQAANTSWGTLNYSSTEPSGTTVAVSTRTSDDAITWSSYSSSITSGEDIPSDNARYLQYKVDFEGTSTTGPQLSSLDLVYATPAPTPSPTPTPTASSGTSGSSSTSNSGSNSSSCSDSKPQVPKLYAIQPEDKTAAKLYFTDEGGSYSKLVVRYGTAENNFSFGTEQTIDKGQRTFTVKDLQVGQKYYFQVRYQNGCNPGEWSNTMSITLPNDRSTGGLTINNIEKDEAENTHSSTTTESNSDAVKTSKSPHEYNLKIKLTNEKGGAVAGAKVILHSEPKETVSDEKGFATFSNVEPGEHTLIVQSDELNGEQNITIGGDDPNLVVTVTLRRDPSRSWMLVGGGVALGALLFGTGYFLYRKLD